VADFDRWNRAALAEMVVNSGCLRWFRAAGGRTVALDVIAGVPCRSQSTPLHVRVCVMTRVCPRDICRSRDAMRQTA
jgi:hypothetical protein